MKFSFSYEACTVSTHVVDDPDAIIDPDPVDDLAAWSFFHAWYLEAFADCVILVVQGSRRLPI